MTVDILRGDIAALPLPAVLKNSFPQRMATA